MNCSQYWRVVKIVSKLLSSICYSCSNEATRQICFFYLRTDCTFVHCSLFENLSYFQSRTNCLPLNRSLHSRSQIFHCHFTASALFITDYCHKRQASNGCIFELFSELICLWIQIHSYPLASKFLGELYR